jgi:hypothetical protein
LKVELGSNNPKNAVDSVFRTKGGILKAKSSGELPMGRTQAYNIKRSIQQQSLSKSVGMNISTSSTRDLLFTVMEQCKNAETTDAFVQDVTCAPEPMYF